MTKQTLKNFLNHSLIHIKIISKNPSKLLSLSSIVVQLLNYKCHKINPHHEGSYIDSPDWIKNKKAPINPINKKDNKCFQYAVTVMLNHEEIKKALQRITKIQHFINKYNWERVNFPSEKDNWKKLEKINITITLNVLYAKKEKIYPPYVSNHNSNHEKQVILLGF